MIWLLVPILMGIVVLDLLATEGRAPFRWAWLQVKRVVRRPTPPPFDFEAAYQAAMEIPVEGEPLYAIEPWTPEEREAFGTDDTLRFIVDLDARLQAADKHRQGRVIRRSQFISVEE